MIAKHIRIPALNLSANAQGVSLMLLSVVLFSANCLIVKYVGASGEVSFWAVNFYRGVAGTAFAVMLAGGNSRQMLRIFHRPLLIVRGVLGAIGLALFYTTVFHMDLGTASVINLTYVLWAALFAALFLSERLGRMQIVGLVVAFAGIPILCGFSLDGVGVYHLVAIAGAMVAGIVVVMIRLLVRTERSTTIYAAQAVYGMLTVVPFMALADFAPGYGYVAMMIGGGVLVAGGQMAMTVAYEHLSVAKGASIQLILPIMNAVGGMAFFHETYGLPIILGSTLIVAGSGIVVRQRQQQQRAVASDVSHTVRKG
ncbi:DMT family transporter [Cerasicoccus maritimus]|uniref:DMT family transporter n=1 Tax=Cerasicoccus maritimus TaxID=490089 RepID=UPI00285250B0|nr:DMT family transporter [Cerasicoccus maritimus]